MTKRAAAIGVLLLAWPAHAQQEACAPRDQALAWLEKEHGEKPFMMLVADNGQLIEMTRSAEGKWTLMHLRPDGKLCLIVTGGDLRMARNS